MSQLRVLLLTLLVVSLSYGCSDSEKASTDGSEPDTQGADGAAEVTNSIDGTDGADGKDGVQGKDSEDGVDNTTGATTAGEDPDQCLLGTHDCDPNADCKDTTSGFECTCKAGFEGNGKSCTDINECEDSESPCPANATCVNTEGAFNCECQPGFETLAGADVNTSECVDINECEDKALNTCDDNATCTNTEGSFECACNVGWQDKPQDPNADPDAPEPLPGTVCIDVDECKNSILNTCDKNATCTNTEGSFTCACNPGWQDEPNADPNSLPGIVCVDVDECAEGGVNACDDNATCTNTDGAYDCACNTGWQDAPNPDPNAPKPQSGTLCIDVDECADKTLNNCDKNATCSNTVGAYECACNANWKDVETTPPNPPGTVCEPGNECAESALNDCDENAICIDTDDGYDCTCPEGWTGDGYECTATPATITVSPSPAYTLDTLSCNADDTTKSAGAVTTVQWIVDDKVLEGATTETLGSDNFVKGQTISCAAKTENVDALTPSQNSVTIANTLPSIETVEISTKKDNVQVTFECTYTGWTDPDTSDKEEVDYSWWLVNTSGVTVLSDSGSTYTSSTLPPSAPVICVVTPKNGTEYGESVSSDVALGRSVARVKKKTTHRVCIPGAPTDTVDIVLDKTSPAFITVLLTTAYDAQIESFCTTFSIAPGQPEEAGPHTMVFSLITDGNTLTLKQPLFVLLNEGWAIWSPPGVPEQHGAQLKLLVEASGSTAQVLDHITMYANDTELLDGIMATLGHKDASHTPSDTESDWLWNYTRMGGRTYLEGADYWSQVTQSPLRALFKVTAESNGPEQLLGLLTTSNFVQGYEQGIQMDAVYNSWPDDISAQNVGPGAARLVERVIAADAKDDHGTVVTYDSALNPNTTMSYRTVAASRPMAMVVEAQSGDSAAYVGKLIQFLLNGYPECSDVSECDDANECTIDACSNKVCGNTVIAGCVKCDDDQACGENQACVPTTNECQDIVGVRYDPTGFIGTAIDTTPDNLTISSTIDVAVDSPGTPPIKDVHVKLWLAHEDGDELNITLEHAGVKVLLQKAVLETIGGNLYVTFDVGQKPADGYAMAAFNGLSADGQWTLKINDIQPLGNTGMLHQWALFLDYDVNDIKPCTNDADCVDENQCTSGQCKNGYCKQSSVICTDWVAEGLPNSCTVDSCEPEVGCINEAVACTTTKECTISECEPITGLCKESPIADCNAVEPVECERHSQCGKNEYCESNVCTELGEEHYHATGLLPVEVTDANPAGISNTIAVPVTEQTKVPSTVYIKLLVAHPFKSDVKITLQRPGIEPIALQMPDGTDDSNDVDAVYPIDATADAEGLANLSSTAPTGLWTLHVQDINPGDVGSLVYWSLHVAEKTTQCKTVDDCPENKCATVTCNTTTEQCEYDPIPYDDGKWCNGAEKCNPAVGILPGKPPKLYDGISCTYDYCDEELDKVVHEPKNSDCNDGNECTVDTCSAEKKGSGCTYEFNVDPCDDGLLCTVGDSCWQGKCLGKAEGEDLPESCSCIKHSDCPVEENKCLPQYACIDNTCQPIKGSETVCVGDADLPCAKDTCDPKTGFCSYTFVDEGIACSDASNCTVHDMCNGKGQCLGTAVTCDDGIFCNGIEACSEATGLCENGPPPVVDDAIDCTLDSCNELIDAVVHEPQSDKCEDGNDCTADVCNPDVGCEYIESSAPCDDGEICTGNDVCENGICKGTPGPCTCFADSDCPDDSNVCNGTLFCNDGLCDINPKTIVTCDTAKDTPCLKNQCDPKVGQCVMIATPAGLPCDDSNKCTFFDTCDFGGNCGGIPKNCNDGIECDGIETCHPALGCQESTSPPNIDDGLACTVEFCNGSTGAVTSKPNDSLCNDGDLCTDDKCGGGTAETGGCSFPGNNADCNDGDVCTAGDYCNLGACMPGPVNPLCEGCEKDEQCPGYNDGNLCNGEMQCVNAKCQVVPGTAITCDTSNDGACVSTTCDPADGQCKTTELGAGMVCDDENGCTLFDTCNDNKECIGVPVKCDDGVFCNGLETCDPKTSQCTPGKAPTADDGHACTVEVCDESQGKIVSAPQDVVCDDNNGCTDDHCDVEKGCQNTPNSAFCNDGESCTVQDVCHEGTCKGTPTLACPCIKDTDCVDDGNLCNGTPICVNLKCEIDPKTVVTCDISKDNACSRTKCAKDTGACYKSLSPYGTQCDDKSVCTQVDQCNGEGGCIGHLPQQCDDGLFCNGEEWCHPTNGCSQGTPPATTDGIQCTSDYCDETADAIMNMPNDLACDDGNVCTKGACDVAEDCIQTPLESGCEDGNACTLNDTCSEGVCQSGEADTSAICTGCKSDSECPKAPNLCIGAMVCHQGECIFEAKNVVCDTSSDTLCGKSKCNPDTGQCQMAPSPAGASCSDDNKCTVVDMCDGQGACTGTEVKCDDSLFCNGLETCSPETGLCVPGVNTVDDGIACTIDKCDEEADVNKHLPVHSMCDDGQLCNGVETCTPGTGCTSGVDHGCDDNDECTINGCDETAHNNAGQCDFSQKVDSCGGKPGEPGPECQGEHALSSGDWTCGKLDACAGGLNGFFGQCMAICSGCPSGATEGIIAIADNTCTTIPIEMDSTSPSVKDVALRLDMKHSNMGEISVALKSPSGDSVSLINQQGAGLAHMSSTWGTTTQSGPPPLQPLCKLKGTQMGGDWTLEICDTNPGLTGHVELAQVFAQSANKCTKHAQCQSGMCVDGYCDTNPGNGCENPVDLTLVEGQYTVAGSTTCSRDNYASTCGGDGGADTVYRITSDSYAKLTVSVEATFDHTLSLRAHNPDTKTCQAGKAGLCINEHKGTNSESTTWGISPGQHYVVVDGVGGQEGTYAITIKSQQFTGPGDACQANDECFHQYCCTEPHCQGGICCDAANDPDCDGTNTKTDNCPAIPNVDQKDADNDGAGDACDPCPLDALDDQDKDGLCADVDKCPKDPNNDEDNDGLCLLDDPCPLDKENDQDGDKLCGSLDTCPKDPNNDEDNDGLCADVDKCPKDPKDDEDNDGLCADVDTCPLDEDNDVDGDGVCADKDACPKDKTKTDPLLCGCNSPETDSDGDSTPDCIDKCANDKTKVDPGDCGCGTPDTDTDKDDIADCIDTCPKDPTNDPDKDGICDDIDPCPGDVGNDPDGDLLCSANDNCPEISNADQTDTDGNDVGDACDQCPGGPCDEFTAFICDEGDVKTTCIIKTDRVITGNQVFNELIITSKGRLTHDGNNSIGSADASNSIKLNWISIKANTMTIESGAQINADGKGYVTSSSGQSAGRGPGAGSSHKDRGGSGAGYGGNGGTGDHGVPGGPAYGSAVDPTHLGSSGGTGHTNSSTGGLGGGLVLIDVVEKLTVHGTISSKGGNASSKNGYGGGGGSGGSINIKAGTWAGGGELTVAGGKGGDNSKDGGGGAGGRIAVSYKTKLYNGKITLTGGHGPNAAGNGAVGTFYQSQPGRLLVPKNVTITLGPVEHLPSNTLSQDTYDQVDVQGGVLVINNHITVNDTFTLDSGIVDIKAGASLTVGTLVLKSGILNNAAANSPLHVTGDATVTGTVTYDRDLKVDGKLTVKSNAVLTHVQNADVSTSDANNSKKNHWLKIAANELTVELGGAIDVTSKGYVSLSSGQSMGRGPGAGVGIKDRGGSGGGYGGKGGTGDHGVPGGAIYGSAINPNHLGSSGGTGQTNKSTGGAGGGLIILDVTETLTVHGLIKAGGGQGASINGYGGGGGSGGTINIIAGNWAGGGELNVTGGTGGDNSKDGGGGAGGRIAVDYNQKTYNGKIALHGGHGPNAADNGGLGTFYEKAPGTLVVQPNMVITLGTQDNDATNTYKEGTFDRVVVKGGFLVVDNKVSVTDKFTLDSGTVQVNPGDSLTVGTLELKSGTMTNDSSNAPITVTGNATVFGNVTFDHDLSVKETLTVKSKGLLTHISNSDVNQNDSKNGKKSHWLKIDAKNLTVELNGAIDVTSKGYVSSSSGQSVGRGPGAGVGMKDRGGSGAGYGGKGGTGDHGVPGGAIYGSAINPIHLGSSGGTGQTNKSTGGAGGGLITLDVTETLKVHGLIKAGGGNGASINGYGGGGGSGGSINITAGHWAGGGELNVTGGKGGDNSKDGGGGAGGRIAVNYDSKTYNGKINLAGGHGPNAAGNGAVGTYYEKTPGQLVVQPNMTITLGLIDDDATNTYKNNTYDDILVKGGTLIVKSDVTVLSKFTLHSGIVQVSKGGSLTVGELMLQSGIITNSADNKPVHVVGNATVTGTVTYDHDLKVDKTLTITSKGTLSHPENGLVSSGDALLGKANHWLNIQAQNITIENGGIIDASSKGYSTPSSGQSTGRGQGAGAGKKDRGGSGAGYGGKGGTGDHGVPGGSAYGSAINSLFLGSSGGTGQTNGSTGGKGGGLIILTVTDVLTVHGTIKATGGNGASKNGYGGGGGSGGTINIETNLWKGGGEFSVAGGTGGDNSKDGGGGSGGRIAVKYGTKTYNGKITLTGGGGPNAAGNGAVGTFFESTKGQLVVQPNMTIQLGKKADDASNTFDLTTYENISVIGGTLRISNDIKVTDKFTLKSGTVEVTAGATLTIGTLVLNSGTMINAATNDPVHVLGDATVTGSVTYDRDLKVDGTLWINSSATLTHPNNSAISASDAKAGVKASWLNVSANNIYVENGGTITASSKGYAGVTSGQSAGRGPGAGNSKKDQGGGGGGYGGIGGTGDSGVPGGLSYGDATNPVYLGSSGGTGQTNGSTGGHGGGLIILTVKEKLTVHGLIVSVGGTGSSKNGYGGGGGSGGSINIQTGTWAGGGELSVTGGKGGDNSKDGGGGAGGRIAVKYTTKLYNGKISVSGGNGPNAASNGAAGTFSGIAQ